MIGGLCQTYQTCMPHELLGFPRDDIEGIFLTAEITQAVNNKAKSTAGTNKEKQTGRQQRMRAKTAAKRPPHKR